MFLIRLTITIALSIALALNLAVNAQKPVAENIGEHVSVFTRQHEKKQNEAPEKPVIKKKKKLDPIKDNPKNCDLENQYVYADFSCHDKPIAPEPVKESSQVAGSGSGNCETEIRRYDWPHSTAIAVMNIESSGNAGVVNDNPATGDYSIGCFQVNIIGNLALGRPSEAELKKAAVNVKWAYNHFVNEGRTFCKPSGWYNTCAKLGLI